MAKKTLLLVGRTGSGKSALANILVNKEGNFEEIFKEGGYSVSETKGIQVEKFELEGKKYQIIDTVGISDTKMEPDEVLSIIVRGCRAAKKGLNQILFVIHEKFTQEEVEAYNVLIKLFDKEVVEYITIIRTKFSNFEEEKECKKDIKLLIDEGNEIITKMIDSCKRRIIHVDNPPINIVGSGKKVEMRIALNKEIRAESRKILLKYLESCQGTYRPKSLDEINKKIDECVKKEDKRSREELRTIIERLDKLEKGENLREGDTLEMLKSQIRITEKLIEDNKKLADKGLFEVVGRGLDKLLDSSLKAAIEVATLANKCTIS